MQHRVLTWCGGFLLVWVALTARASVYTLSDEEILSLDWSGASYTGEIVATRDVPGPGVELDIRYPTVKSPGNGIQRVSGRRGGAGRLADVELTEHDSFALSFELVAVNGICTPPAGGILVVGSLVYGEKGGSRYRPEAVSLSSNARRTATSITDIGEAGVGGLGFTTHFLSDGKGWEDDTTLTLKVSPAAGARRLSEVLKSKASAQTAERAEKPSGCCTLPRAADRAAAFAPRADKPDADKEQKPPRNVTLSDKGLMSLDWHDDEYAGRVVAVRNVPGPGVEFDIRFPDTKAPGYALEYISGKYGGQGRLAGLDLSTFDNFALTFTLVAVDAASEPPAGGKLVVGAIVYDPANHSRFRPVCVSLSSKEASSATSVTTLTKDPVDGLGFETHLMTPDKWKPGTTVTLLIAPAEGALQLPEDLDRAVATARPSPPRDRAAVQSPQARPAKTPKLPRPVTEQNDRAPSAGGRSALMTAAPPGTTYREWLIGMGLAGGRSASDAIRQADEVLRQLEVQPQR